MWPSTPSLINAVRTGRPGAGPQGLVGVEQLPDGGETRWGSERVIAIRHALPAASDKFADAPFREEEIARLEQSLAPYGAAIRVIEKANRSLGAQLTLVIYRIA